jgi:hypothetical protein
MFSGTILKNTVVVKFFSKLGDSAPSFYGHLIMITKFQVRGVVEGNVRQYERGGGGQQVYMHILYLNASSVSKCERS